MGFLHFINLIVVGDLKTVIVMANVKLIFNGSEASETDRHTLIAYANVNNEIYIKLEMNNNYPSFICLDKPTAVRLVRELKKQIGYLESEVKDV